MQLTAGRIWYKTFYRNGRGIFVLRVQRKSREYYRYLVLIYKCFESLLPITGMFELACLLVSSNLVVSAEADIA